MTQIQQATFDLWKKAQDDYIAVMEGCLQLFKEGKMKECLHMSQQAEGLAHKKHALTQAVDSFIRTLPSEERVLLDPEINERSKRMLKVIDMHSRMLGVLQVVG